jgi:hypothetical protein
MEAVPDFADRFRNINRGSHGIHAANPKGSDLAPPHPRVGSEADHGARVTSGIRELLHLSGGQHGHVVPPRSRKGYVNARVRTNSAILNS